MNAAAVLSGLISQVFEANRDMMKDIYVQSRRDEIEKLRKDEFNQAWSEASKPFYDKCAAIVFDTIRRSSPELEERVVATIKDPTLAGYPDGTETMFPSYIYLLAYYMYTGKSGKTPQAKQIDKLCAQTIESWMEEWEKDINELMNGYEESEDDGDYEEDEITDKEETEVVEETDNADEVVEEIEEDAELDEDEDEVLARFTFEDADIVAVEAKYSTDGFMLYEQVELEDGDIILANIDDNEVYEGAFAKFQEIMKEEKK